MKARNRFAHEIMIVVNVFPVMIQRLGERLIDANALHNIVMTKQELLKTLNTREKNILKGLPNGYKNCDMVFLYKMLRISNILKNPKSGYGHKPLSSDISIEDDVERLRILRNELCHRANPEISEEDHELFSQTVISISKRWDKICGSEFAKQIDELLSRDIKEHRIAHYIKKIREEEELKYTLVLAPPTSSWVSERITCKVCVYVICIQQTKAIFWSMPITQLDVRPDPEELVFTEAEQNVVL
ncbi:Hypothetical predicted protein [Mytilus galloprovincialis]|uniref:DZIP3-like HEPN domain-containing protein n=1 Tax=Mytilus galloprovincialis TaxID=29158 RepID=A0A8B6CLZ8_MYTGA|nr:Hypothetical predicted protein [Mytilus galloprovincialis]